MPFIVKRCSSEANIKNSTKQIKVDGMVKFEQNLTSFAMDSLSPFFFFRQKIPEHYGYSVTSDQSTSLCSRTVATHRGNNYIVRQTIKIP